MDTKGGRWIATSTPQTLEVRKGDGPMTVSCSKDGYKTTEIVVEEGFAGMTPGNVLIGGGIGLVVDAASGAAQEYPDNVYVWMEPVSWASAEEEEAWHSAKQAYDDEQKAKEEAMHGQKNYSSESGNQ